jgi:RNA polymerase sigma-70 factor (ECF subfamily)
MDSDEAAAHAPAAGKATLTCIDYNSEHCQVEEVRDPAEFLARHRPEWSVVRWINVDGATDPVLTKALAQKYQLHPLAVEDLLHPGQRPKAEDYDDAQDAIQEAFLKCWRRLEKIKRVRKHRGWIFRVAVNAAKDLQRNTWRSRVRPLPRAAHVVSNGQTPPEIAANREDQRRLRAALADLRPEEREVYLLRMNSCLTYEEIAALRNCPVGTVKTHMRTAIARLRQVLGGT